MSKTQGLLLQEEYGLMRHKESRGFADEFIDLHCGPGGIRMPEPMSPYECLYDAWELVGFCIQEAMDEIGSQVA